MNDPTNILWRIVSSLEVQSINKSADGWNFRPGLKIFTNPSAKCPNCNNWIPTNRIWLVDETGSKLLNCWRLDGSQVTGGDRDIVHPHAHTPTRAICKGNTKGASNALFAGPSEGIHYHSTELWFEQLGHECEFVDRLTCLFCREIHVSGGFLPYERTNDHICTYCQIGREGDRCDECRHWFDGDGVNEEGYCDNCRENRSIYCVHCGEIEVEEAGGWCDDCHGDNHCPECGIRRNPDRLLCDDCGPYRCEGCDKGIADGEYCEDCVDEIEE